MNYYFGEEGITLEEAAVKYKLPKAYIKELIEKKYIHATDLTKYGEQGIMIDLESQQRLRVLSDHPEYKQKVLDFNPSSYYDFCSEIIEYHPFHDFIDRYCWLIKLFYTDKQDIKKKKYKLDVLFQNFLIKNKFSLNKLTQTVTTPNGDDDKLIFHLQKGWYNELVRSVPLNENYLQIGTKVKGSVADATSVSWNITQTYYSIYEYTNSLDFLFRAEINTKEHRRSTNIFNTYVLDILKDDILFYPFFLSSSSKNNKAKKYPEHTKFSYANYPRDTSKNIQDVNKDVIKTLKSLSKETGKSVCLIDFLYEFRVWANYTGIQTITKLENGYLLDYLYKNLGTINFFVGGICELSAIAKLGQEEYLKVFNTFVEDYVLKQPHFEQNILLVPIFIRHRIYHHLGILTSIPSFLSSIYKDPVKLVMQESKNNKVKDSKKDEDGLLVKLSNMSIKEIAEFIIDDWSKSGKVPKAYLEPMLTIKTLEEMYYADKASSVVAYFISNASGWKGFNARVTKKYLKKMLTDYYKKQ